MIDWLWILVGLVTLLVSADALVRGAVWLALALGVSPMMVGLTLVAFGTSAPELFVSVVAAIEGSPGFATGNALGSNIANIGLIIGTTAALRPITQDQRTIRFEVGYLLATAGLVLVPFATGRGVQRFEGVLLLALLAWFTLHLVRREKDRRRNQLVLDSNESRRAAGMLPALLNVGLVGIGLVGLSFGSEWLVDGAKGVASQLGISDAIVGIAIIAVGTSLPELATSALAARKGHSELALGNILGSNVFNVCMVLGATGVIAPLPMSWADEGWAAVVGLLFSIALAGSLRTRNGVSRSFGVVLLVAYAAYVAALIATA